MFFLFCKRKTAYEMRMSDWSSDVCSSDLDEAQVVQRPDMDTLVKTDTVAEAVDVMSFQGRAESVPSSVLERFEQDAKPARAAMNDAIRQEGQSRSAHARSIGLAHAVVCSLCEQPEVMWAMLARKGPKVPERTAKWP